MGSQSSSSSYYQQCARVKLQGQVGSWYFVTAANAGKVLFLRDAAISFLRYSSNEALHSVVPPNI